jgi:putative oxidoreductase
VGLFLLRIILGTVFIAHGSQKLGLIPSPMGGPDAVVAMVKGMGFNPPAVWAWLLIAAEFGGGLGILFGFLTPLSAIGLIISMGVAIAKVHGANGFFAPKGFEYPLALLGMAACLLFAGPGRASLDYLFFGRKHNSAEEG